MEFQTIIECLEKSSHIGIHVPADPDMDALASAEALARGIEAKGKTVGFLPPFASLERFPKGIFAAISSSSPLPKEFIVSLNTADSPVSQLRYEKLDDKIEIIFSPQKNPVRENAITYRTGKILCDAVIAVGADDPESLRQSAESALSPETPIIPIGMPHSGEPGVSSLSEIVFSLITQWDSSLIDPSVANLLLAGVLSATGHFSGARAHAATLAHAAAMLRSGAHFSEAERIAGYARPLSLLQLYGRAVVRSKMSRDNRVLWSFLTLEDFEKTNRSPRDIPLVLAHLMQEFAAADFIALLWQNTVTREVEGAIASANEEALSEFAAQMSGERMERAIRFGARFRTFPEAEDALGALLQSAL